MLEMWQDEVPAEPDASGGGSAWLRGEPTSCLSRPSEEGLIPPEAEMSRRVPHRLGMLCLYDLRRFAGL